MTEVTPQQIATFSERFDRIASNVEKVIQGKRDVIELVLLALVAEGHVLVEDVPGVGKTQLAKSVARSIDSIFNRIQFTPDLLPSDVTGVSVWDRNLSEFEFKPGPIFANLVVGDEINRASPKTQSALLEAMEERQVTSDGTTRVLPLPFMVMATQNPLEHEGTYPLPEAQLDRFMMRVVIGYPSRVKELEILDTHAVRSTFFDLEPVVSVGRGRRDGDDRAGGGGVTVDQDLHHRPGRGNQESLRRAARGLATGRPLPAASGTGHGRLTGSRIRDP